MTSDAWITLIVLVAIDAVATHRGSRRPGLGETTMGRGRRVRTMEWTVHGERRVYDNEWMRVALVDVELPSGARFEHHVLRMPAQASGVVVDVADRGVLLLWRHRFITDTWGWELPAGRVDAGETPIEAGARETLEETGWQPGPLAPMFTYFPHNGTSDMTLQPVRRHVGHARRRSGRSRRVRTGRVAAVGHRPLGDRRRADPRRDVADGSAVPPRPDLSM